MEVPQVRFYTNDNINMLWAFIKSILFTSAPGVMIWVAITAVGMLLIIIVKAFRDAHKDDDDDDDIEIKHY